MPNVMIRVDEVEEEVDIGDVVNFQPMVSIAPVKLRIWNIEKDLND